MEIKFSGHFIVICPGKVIMSHHIYMAIKTNDKRKISPQEEVSHGLTTFE